MEKKKASGAERKKKKEGILLPRKKKQVPSCRGKKNKCLFAEEKKVSEKSVPDIPQND